jgi:glycosyltransferase involved in cell wall biosynthesis
MASVDVVIPCYQYGRFLRDAVTSVLGQDISQLRVLVIDNASTDDSLEVARQLALEDRRLEVVAHRTNLGATASYNEGVEWASADYFLLLDADDMLAPGALQRAVSVMERNLNVSFTHGREAHILPNNQIDVELGAGEAEWRIITGRAFIESYCRTPVNIVGANTAIRRTSAQKKVGYYRASLDYSNDMEIWLRLASVGDVARGSMVQAIRRVHQHQHTEQYRSFQVRDFVERERTFVSFFENEGKTLPRANKLLEQARRGLGEHAYWSALSHLVRRRPAAAWALFRFSMTRRPGKWLLPPVGWLLRMDRPLARTFDVVLEATKRGRTSAVLRNTR